jgi:membrane-bound metal-dependent hydrolase YbcI (DUF457 family)
MLGHFKLRKQSLCLYLSKAYLGEKLKFLFPKVDHRILKHSLVFPYLSVLEMTTIFFNSLLQIFFFLFSFWCQGLMHARQASTAELNPQSP